MFDYIFIDDQLLNWILSVWAVGGHASCAGVPLLI